MSHFLPGPPVTVAAWQRDDGTPIWITSEPIRFQLGQGGWAPTFTVPAGFETDLGSIPAILRAIWNPGNPRCARAYILHDWINQLTAGRPPGPGVWSSQLAAAVLAEALLLDGEPVWSVKAQSLGVWLGIAAREWR